MYRIAVLDCQSDGDVTRFDFYEPNTSAPIRDQVFVFNEVENKKKGFRVVTPQKGAAAPAP